MEGIFTSGRFTPNQPTGSNCDPLSVFPSLSLSLSLSFPFCLLRSWIFRYIPCRVLCSCSPFPLLLHRTYICCCPLYLLFALPFPLEYRVFCSGSFSGYDLEKATIPLRAWMNSPMAMACTHSCILCPVNMSSYKMPLTLSLSLSHDTHKGGGWGWVERGEEKTALNGIIEGPVDFAGL